MFVVKRSNDREEVSFDKVLKRIKVLSGELDVNFFEVAQKVCSRIYDGVRTSELDELAAQMCSSMILEHPDYGTLASRIIISNHHKNTSPSFSETIQILYDNKDVHGEANPLVSDELYEVVRANKEKLNSYIDYSRDYNFDYFGFKTLEKAYLMRVGGRVVERPQHMFMRVALGIHGGDVKDALQTYDMMSTKHFVHATPTLFNSGTRVPQMSSCYLYGMDDSIDGIFKCLKDCAHISKYAGGIGIHIHNIRARNSVIRGTNGVSTGIVPMLRVYNNTARYVNQSGRRNGSIAVYMEPWHADIEHFIEMRKNHGNEEERARDLFYALWIPDLFMKRVQDGGVWSLMCPDACKGLSDCYGEEFEKLYMDYEARGMFVKQMDAQDLWFRILQSQIETGTPYMLYKDHVNRKNNQSNIGVIKSSNLCVAPETLVLTDRGHMRICDLEGMQVNVWNGREFSTVLVRKTGVGKRLVTVKLNNGFSMRCTPYHKFYVVGSGGRVRMIEAKDLTLGMRLVDMELPTLNLQEREYMPHAYAHGLYAGVIGHRIVLDRREAKTSEVLEHIDWKYMTDVTPHHVAVELVEMPEDKYSVPMNFDLESRLGWLGGLLDAAAVIEEGGREIRVASRYPSFLVEVAMMLQTLGVKARVYKGELLVAGDGVAKLRALGLKTYKLNLDSVRCVGNYNEVVFGVQVVGVEDRGDVSDTYCFNEPIRHMGVFNGILTGQCSEIMEVSDDKTCAVCNLASMCLPTYVDVATGAFDYDKLHAAVKVVVKNLNKVIDRNFYPIEEARASNMRDRPIGIGVQGLADVFAMLKIAYESDEARVINKQIFETMYHAALEASCELAKKLGAYETFARSPASEGRLQFDMWGVEPSGKYDWDALRAAIRESGLRNSLLLAPMPTASTSQIMGFTESFEPITSNIYKRKTLAGEFILVNKYLVRDLKDIGLWTQDIRNHIVVNDGSIQNIAQIPQEIRDRYKTVWECKMRSIIDMAADRGAFIDQSQSMNLYVENPDFKKLTAMHFHAWNRGLKTGMYYLRSKAKSSAQKFTVDPRLEKQLKGLAAGSDAGDTTDTESVCLTCSA